MSSTRKRLLEERAKVLDGRAPKGRARRTTEPSPPDGPATEPAPPGLFLTVALDRAALDTLEPLRVAGVTIESFHGREVRELSAAINRELERQEGKPSAGLGVHRFSRLCQLVNELAKYPRATIATEAP